MPGASSLIHRDGQQPANSGRSRPPSDFPDSDRSDARSRASTTEQSPREQRLHVTAIIGKQIPNDPFDVYSIDQPMESEENLAISRHPDGAEFLRHRASLRGVLEESR